MNEKQEQSILKTKIAERCRKKGVKMTFVYDLLCVSSSSYYRVLSKPLSDLHVERLAGFLEVPSETIHNWHGVAVEPEQPFANTTLAKNIDQPPEPISLDERLPHLARQKGEDLSKPSVIWQKQNKIHYNWLLLALVLILLTTTVYLKSSAANSVHHQGKFYGFGSDYDLSSVNGLNDFHIELYTYKFENVEATINGDQIDMISHIFTNSIDGENADYIGIFEATGKYLNGFAAMHYKITAEQNGEHWIGVMMLKIGTTGHANGYWLTAHNDSSETSIGPFAFGDTNLKRVQETIGNAIADSN